MSPYILCYFLYQMLKDEGYTDDEINNYIYQKIDEIESSLEEDSESDVISTFNAA